MKTHRLFFALWPTEQVMHSIIEICSQLPEAFQSRLTAANNWHVTLHFVGAASNDEKDCLRHAARHFVAAARQVNVAPFEYTLDCFGFFPKSGIVWMGTRAVPSALRQLQHELGRHIEQCDYAVEKRAYTPHLTLMKKCRQPLAEQPVFSIPWLVDEFALVESSIDQYGVNYQLIEKFSLA